LKNFERRQAGISDFVQGQVKMSSEILYVVLVAYNQEKMHSGWKSLDKGTSDQEKAFLQKETKCSLVV